MTNDVIITKTIFEVDGKAFDSKEDAEKYLKAKNDAALYQLITQRDETSKHINYYKDSFLHHLVRQAENCNTWADRTLLAWLCSVFYAPHSNTNGIYNVKLPSLGVINVTLDDKSTIKCLRQFAVSWAKLRLNIELKRFRDLRAKLHRLNQEIKSHVVGRV